MKQFVREYAINCPVCETARVADARMLWFLHGFILFARYGSRTIIGCVACVRRESIEATGINAVGGWWCFPWGLLTPLVLLQNIWETLRPHATPRIDAVLQKAGIDPNDVRLDSQGFTREQRRLVDAASYVLATAVWADGQATLEEHARAVEILQQVTGSQLGPEQVAARIAAGHEWTGRLIDLPFELRQTLLRMALDIALADGSLSRSEMSMLHTLAERLGFAASSVKAMLEKVLGTTSDTNSESASREQQSHHRSKSGDDVNKAALILEVTTTASLVEVKNAWRRAMLKYHPDRAGGDPVRQREFTAHSQEINWAHNVLQRHASTAL